jgi:hypothetical protein
MGGPRRDEAATGLAVLALLPADRAALTEGRRGRAVGAAARWLLERQRTRRDDEPASPENEAIAASALLALYEATGDPSLERPLDRAVRRVARAPLGADAGQPALQWTRDALRRARGLGWNGLDAPLEGVETRLLALRTDPEPRIDLALLRREPETVARLR